MGFTYSPPRGLFLATSEEFHMATDIAACVGLRHSIQVASGIGHGVQAIPMLPCPRQR